MDTNEPRETHDMAACLAQGTIAHLRKDVCAGECPWNAHPVFQGVALRHLVTGADTAGALSCHVVRIDPGCVLEEHVHAGQWELHEIVRGQGRARFAGRDVAYRPGCMAVIPMGQAHRVEAGPDGLVLLAKFFPALL
ncbi:MAG: cupin domain-containing protein [Desulfovibrionaceae bacterium]